MSSISHSNHSNIHIPSQREENTATFSTVGVLLMKQLFSFGISLISRRNTAAKSAAAIVATLREISDSEYTI